MSGAGYVQEQQFRQYAPTLTPKNAEACRIWNQVGGLDWTGLQFVLGLEPVDDVRGLLQRLYLIRDAMRS